tara:strand:- start:559 stop:1077 length:519 start_codon:yes stop_codon:yes gene_type:complete
MTTYPIAEFYSIVPTAAKGDHGDVAGEHTLVVPPSTYTNNSFGQYCVISLVDVGLNLQTQSSGVAITLQTPTLNGSSSGVNGGGVFLSHSSVTSIADTGAGGFLYFHSFTHTDIKYLIPARPSQLKIKIFPVGSTSGGIHLDDDGYLTFKFEYISAESVNMLGNEVSYNPAF